MPRTGTLPALVAGGPPVILWFLNFAAGGAAQVDPALLVVHVAVLLAVVLGILGAVLRFADACVVAAFLLLAAGVPMLTGIAPPLVWAPAAGFLLAARWTPGYEGSARLLARSVGAMAAVGAGLLTLGATWMLVRNEVRLAAAAWAGLLVVTLLLSTLAAWMPDHERPQERLVVAPPTA